MNALALTDHGNLHGSLEFYQKARKADLNPIVGYEAYIAPGDRRSREASTMKEASFHLTLLAQNKRGTTASRASRCGLSLDPQPIRVSPDYS